MLWGADSDHTSVWEANANTAIANGAQYLLGCVVILTCDQVPHS